MSKTFNKRIRSVIGKLFFDEKIILKNIFDYCQNDFLVRQSAAGGGIDFAQDERYQYYKQIHELLNVMEPLSEDVDLCRVGKEDDGGYIMAKGPDGFSSGKIAYSIGICDDVSWDLEMARAGYEIYQYDHTIKKLPIQNKAFHWKKIGLTGEHETKELKTLETILKENKHKTITGALLKMDIEGWEWDVLKNCKPEIFNKFDQILIELHNFHNMENKKSIIEALENINRTHQVVHLHANNMSPVSYRGDIIMPNCLEVIYLNKDKYEFKKCNFISPTPLDKPNLPRIPDIKLGQWNL